MTGKAGHVWDVEVKPHLTPIFAYGAAAILSLIHI